MFICLSLIDTQSKRFLLQVCHCVNKLYSHYFQQYQGQVTTIAGCGRCGFADGQHQNAMFNFPKAICFSQFHGSLFVCDYNNHMIRKIDLKTGIDSFSILLWNFACSLTQEMWPLLEVAHQGLKMELHKTLNSTVLQELHILNQMDLCWFVILSITRSERLYLRVYFHSSFSFNFQYFFLKGAKTFVKTIVEQPNSDNTTSLKCNLKYPRTIHLDNKSNICYFVAEKCLYKFYNL